MKPIFVTRPFADPDGWSFKDRYGNRVYLPRQPGETDAELRARAIYVAGSAGGVPIFSRMREEDHEAQA